MYYQFRNPRVYEWVLIDNTWIEVYLSILKHNRSYYYKGNVNAIYAFAIEDD